MRLVKYLYVFIVLVITKSYAAKILAVIPTPSISHQVPFRPLLRELARRGHEVTVITADPAFPKGQTPENYTEIDLHDISYDIWRKGILHLSTGKSTDTKRFIIHAFDLFVQVWEEQLKQKEVQAIINGTEKFDLLMLEACSRGALAFRHKFKVPVIQMSSFGAIANNYETVGAPTHPILYPSMLRQRLYNLTFWEKLNEVYNHYYFLKYINDHEEKEANAMRKFFGKDMPSLTELQNYVDMLFLNIHPIFEGSVPVPPTVVHMWGIHKKPEKELPKDLKSYLDSSKHGVIYMSFGTNVDPKYLPPEILGRILKVLSELPYDVLFKWNYDELPISARNIKISKWFPQSDLLRHSKIKLFITQGGLQSTDEAITAGVPLVGIPMLGDQWYNVEKYVYHGIGVKLNAETITEDSLRNAITTVIEDESYRKNIVKLGEVMRDEPMGALERAVWWTEYVLRHAGARHLRSPAANISWAEYLQLEFVLTLLTALLIVLSTALVMIYLLFSYCFKNNGTNAKLKDN